MKQIALFTLIAMMLSCNASKESQGTSEALAPVIVYKTKTDHFNHVPVTLNEAGDKIVSYPAPSDLYHEGILALPLKLDKGYLLDQRGISSRSAFTSFTYEEYSKMETAPSPEVLLNSITDPDPFQEIYDCGNRGQYESIEKDLNKLIRKNFKGSKSLTE